MASRIALRRVRCSRMAITTAGRRLLIRFVRRRCGEGCIDMPTRAPRPCAQSGCPSLVSVGRFCAEHAQMYQAAQDAQRGTTAQRGYGARWQRLRRLALASHPICADPYRLHPGEIKAATDVDHIMPKAKGGHDTLDNLQPLCHSCHSHKTSTQDGGFGHA
ncbi:MAG: HNH endonuclease [Terrimicrobiaceae bacterium]